MGWFSADKDAARAAAQTAAAQQAAMAQVSALQQQIGAAWGQAAAAVTDPDQMAFMQQPVAEQAREQAELQEYGTNLRLLWENGLDAEITLRSIQPTGRTLAGQHEYTVQVDIAVTGREPYQLTLRQVIPAASFPSYVVGGRYRAKVASDDPSNAGLFERIG